MKTQDKEKLDRQVSAQGAVSAPKDKVNRIADADLEKVVGGVGKLLPNLKG